MSHTYTEVFENVFLGDRITAQDAYFLKESKIAYVLNCTDELKNFFEGKMSVQQAVYTPLSSPASSVNASPNPNLCTPKSDDFMPIVFDSEDNSSQIAPILLDTVVPKKIDELVSSEPHHIVQHATIPLGKHLDDAPMVSFFSPSPAACRVLASSPIMQPLPVADMLKFDIDGTEVMQYFDEEMIDISQLPMNDAMVLVPPSQDNATQPIMSQETQLSSQQSAVVPGFETPKPKKKKKTREECDDDYDPSSTRKKKVAKKKPTPKKDGETTPVNNNTNTKNGTDPATPTRSALKPPKGYCTQVVTIQFEHAIQYKRIAVRDSRESDIKKYFDEGAAFIDKSIHSVLPNSKDENNQPIRAAVLVHCKEARSRSISMLVAYAMKCHNMKLSDAYQHIHDKTNGRIKINDGFKRQLMEYEIALFKLEENTHNFFPQRKRVRNYSSLHDPVSEELASAEQDDDDFQLQPKQKKQRIADNLPAASTLFAYFPVVTSQGKKQTTLFDLLSAKKKPISAVKVEEQPAVAVVPNVPAAEQVAVVPPVALPEMQPAIVVVPPPSVPKSVALAPPAKKKQMSLTAFFKPKVAA